MNNGSNAWLKNMTNNSQEKLIEIRIPLKNIPSKYWNKIEVGNDWDKEYQTNNSNRIPMMTNANELEEKPYNEGKYWGNNACDKSFKNEEILNGFKKYTQSDKIFFLYRHGGKADGKNKEKTLIKDIEINEWFYIENIIQLTKYLRDANKLFVKDGHGKVTSQEALEFLQSIIESKYIKATIRLTQFEFEHLFELENKLKEINSQNQSLKEELEEISSELLEIKKSELTRLIKDTKSKLKENLHGYLDILLITSDKSLISDKAKQSLSDKINDNELQKLLLLQHQINHLEKKISEVQQVTQIEVLPPSYNQ
ncbi:MAG: hypothetical protein mread185_000004 [Mycoplasmataceae bacterium]|nr:MAG: hypothetical protein mread185_000004 [Mycoplasmataceae bacterium]